METESPVPARQELLAHARFVRGLAGQLVRDSADADDLAQEALLAGLRATGRPRVLRAWLAGAVHRLSWMRRRSEARRRKRELAARAPASSDPAQVLAQMEVQRGLVDAVLGLREPYRSTIVHRYFHDLAPAEIAGLVGVPLDTVRTRLARAHALLRERLDHVHSSRAAWSAPLLGFANLPLGKGPGTAATGVLLMTSATKVFFAVSLVITAALGVWVGTRIAAPHGTEPGPGPTPAHTEVADVPGTMLEPGARTKSPDRSQATGPVAPDAKVPVSMETKPETETAKPTDGKNPLDDVDWPRWIPTLAKYGALARGEDPPEALWKELEKFLSDVSPRLKGRRWEAAEDLFRMPDVASRFTMAAVEHFGAKLTVEQRTKLRTEIEKAMSEELAGRKDLLGIEKMSESLQAVARVYRLLEQTAGPEYAASVAGLITGLLQDRGWGTLELGSIAAAGFTEVVLQFFEFRATLEGGERADTIRLLRDWWERAGNVLRDLARVHGATAVRAAVLAATDDDEQTARARAAPTFPGIRALVWAALIREQAVAERAFHDLWKKLPEDRRKAFERAEPALLLFWPTAS